jgi:hypothetical protein
MAAKGTSVDATIVAERPNGGAKTRNIAAAAI